MGGVRGSHLRNLEPDEEQALDITQAQAVLSLSLKILFVTGLLGGGFLLLRGHL